jgi:hypothetical protein
MDRNVWYTKLLRRTVWYPDALGVEEWKYRQLKRIWLPVFYLLALLAGIWTFIFASMVSSQIMGAVFALAAIGCIHGVAIPRLFMMEIVGNVILATLLAASGAIIFAYNRFEHVSGWFIAYVIMMSIPIIMFRLSLLGEEIKERRSGVESEEA